MLQKLYAPLPGRIKLDGFIIQRGEKNADGRQAVVAVVGGLGVARKCREFEKYTFCVGNINKIKICIQIEYSGCLSRSGYWSPNSSSGGYYFALLGRGGGHSIETHAGK